MISRRSRAQQASLGWSSFVSFSDGRIRYRINDRTGHPVGLESVAVKFMRPVDDREDRRMMLALDQSGDFVADEAVADGVWLIEIEADAGMKKPFRETLRLRVAQGERQ
jgi:nitrogen fixation protein FixH